VHFHFVQYKSALCTKYELRLILNTECLLSSSEQCVLLTLVQLCLWANQLQVRVLNKSFWTTTISSQNSKLCDSQKPSSITCISKTLLENSAMWSHKFYYSITFTIKSFIHCIISTISDRTIFPIMSPGTAVLKSGIGPRMNFCLPPHQS